MTLGFETLAWTSALFSFLRASLPLAKQQKHYSVGNGFANGMLGLGSEGIAHLTGAMACRLVEKRAHRRAGVI